MAPRRSEEVAMTRRNRKGGRGLFVGVLPLVATLVLVACGGTTSPSNSLKPQTKLIVGAIHVGSVKDAGYNQAQHDGIMAMQKAIPGVKVIEAENVPEGPDVVRVMQNMIGQGATMLFPQSFGYMDFGLQVAKSNPGVFVEHPAGYKLSNNFGTYWAASDQVDYALGIAAAMTSKTGKLGFVGAMPIPTVLASAIAFHQGARSVNPHTTTTVIFNGSWSDPGKEAAATNTLADKGVDVVACLVDSPITVVKTAEARHIYAIGYHSAAAAKYAPNYWLSGVAFDWSSMFTTMANNVINGTWKSQMLIAPASSGVAYLAPFGPKVPSSAQAAATKAYSEFKSGVRTSAFMGPIYDQSGKLRVAKGKYLTPQDEQNVYWLAQGMIGKTK
jgi:basic membrane lipoprotein Med (substrate-binding protein (PBP1-ABC) superfamily)